MRSCVRPLVVNISRAHGFDRFAKKHGDAEACCRIILIKHASLFIQCVIRLTVNTRSVRQWIPEMDERGLNSVSSHGLGFCVH